MIKILESQIKTENIQKQLYNLILVDKGFNYIETSEGNNMHIYVSKAL